MTSTTPAPVPAPAPTGSAFLSVIVPIAGIVVAVATIIISYQINRISDMSSDLRGATGRIDQIYPLIVTQTGDIGFIKGSLEATAQKIAVVEEKNEEMTKRIGALVSRQEALFSSQEAMAKNVQELSASLSKLSDTISAQQNRKKDQ